jgi:hypothetical protein
MNGGTLNEGGKERIQTRNKSQQKRRQRDRRDGEGERERERAGGLRSGSWRLLTGFAWLSLKTAFVYTPPFLFESSIFFF